MDEEDDLLLISDSGKLIRIRAHDISVYSRTAAGVKVMNTNGAKLIAFQRVVNDDELAREAEKAVESGEEISETEPAEEREADGEETEAAPDEE